MKKFDVLIGNPPYAKKVGPTKTQHIWNDFVKHSFEISKVGGYVLLIHPNAWRQAVGAFTDIKDILTSHRMIYLECHNYDDGQKLFGVRTSYDVYLSQNIKVDRNSTTVKFKDMTVNLLNINELPFIPTSSYDILSKLLAKDGEDSVELLYNRSAYGTDKDNILDEKTDEFRYPVIYTITQTNGINYKWSNTNQKGHFGVPKVIWSNGMASYPIVDISGEYGLTQFAYAIADEPENLENIRKAMESDKFMKFMNSVKLSDSKYDRRVISTFRKDFWKEFI